MAAERTRTSNAINFYQKKLFFKWLKNNNQLFSHEPYLAEEGDCFFSMRFNGITENISCCFQEQGDIMIMVDYRNECYDIVTDFDLVEEQTPAGRFQCILCRDNPDRDNPNSLVYETRERVWIKHSFEPLVQWTLETFTDDSVLWYDGVTAAQITSREELEELQKNGESFKKIQVIIPRRSLCKQDYPFQDSILIHDSH
jgi:hypothetical protein